MSIRKRSDRRGYLVDVEVSGRRMRRQVPTIHEAERIEKLLQRANREGGYVALLGDVLREYTAHLRVMRKRRSAQSADYHAEVLLAHFGDAFNAAVLGPKDIAGFVRARRDRDGCKVSTVNGHLRTLRAALNFAVRSGKLRSAPRIELLKEGRRIPTKLTLEDVERLVAAAPDRETALAILLAAHAGLRHDEICHLRVSDIDLEARKITITAKPEVGWTPKAYHERVIPMSNRLTEAVRPMVSVRSPMAWLFPGRDRGRPCASFAAKVRAAFKACGLHIPARKPGLHMLRRTFASTLIKQADLETVKELGGWSSISVLERYTVSDDETKREAISSVFDTPTEG